MKLSYLGSYHSLQHLAKGRFPATLAAINSTHFHFRKPIPQLLKSLHWRLRPFHQVDAVVSYEACLQTPQPHQAETYTWQDHTHQIALAQQMYWTNEQISLAILNPKEDKCWGGVQIAPLRPFFHRHNAPNHLMIRADQNVAMITCWWGSFVAEGQCMPSLITALHHWLLQKWELSDHLFAVNLADTHIANSIETMGLRRHFCLTTAVSPYQYVFYGR